MKDNRYYHQLSTSDRRVRIKRLVTAVVNILENENKKVQVKFCDEPTQRNVVADVEVNVGPAYMGVVVARAATIHLGIAWDDVLNYLPVCGDIGRHKLYTFEARIIG